MKKLQDLTREELKALYDKNKQFAEAVREAVYDDYMIAQAHEYEDMGADVFEYSDHYSSFYLSTPKVSGAKSPEKVAGALDADYLNEENGKLYAELCEKIKRWEDMTTDEQDTDEGAALYDEAIETCDKLADGITKQLRSWEDIDDGSIESELEEIRGGYRGMSEWETDGAQVFEHITKCYK